MSRVIRMTLFCAGLALAGPACGGDTAATALLPSDSVSTFKLSASADPYATLSTATVTGQPFSKALRIVVAEKPERTTEVQIAAPVDAAVADGDVLLVTFWMRSGADGDASLDAGFRPVPNAEGRPPRPGGPAGGPGSDAPQVTAPGAAPGSAGAPPRPRPFRWFSRPLFNAPAEAGTAWKKVQFPFALTRAFDKGEAEVFFTLGLRAQTVEIGGIALENYGTTKQVAELPFTRLGYEGSEPDAAWRTAAEERIEQYRKGDLTVVVKDRAGNPVRGAEVAVKMRKHAFLWGTAVNASLFSNQRIDAEALEKYKQEIVRLFNCAVMENETKWPQWSHVESRPATTAVIDWLRESGLQVRGHNLVWPSWRNSNVQAAIDAKDDPKALAKVILDHITETTTELKGKLVDWDVLNEPFSNHDFMDILGRHAMVDWFKAAHAGDPNAKLYINDFAILADDDQAHRDDYAATIQYLIDEGAPLDGIGLQSHFPSRVTPMDELLRRLDRFAAFGKELEITEFDINTSDEVTQADYTRDFMTAAFSCPQVKAFLLWGFWEGAHWRPSGAMLRRDWSAKPNGEIYQDLVFKKWWTNADGETGDQGIYTTRGFLGDYDIEVKAGDQTKTVEATISKDGSRVECVLD